MSKKRRWMIYLGILVILTGALFLKAFDNRIHTVYYDIESTKIQDNIKIVYISDLHGTDFSKNQREIMEKVEKEKPDAVFLGGDIFDDQDPWDKSIELLDQLKGRYEAYFVSGNHEYNTRKIEEIKKIIRDRGIKILEGETIPLEIKNTKIDLSGTDDNIIGGRLYEDQLKKAALERRGDVFSVLLTHQPRTIGLFNKYNYDLILAGHNHGGQVRIPFIADGLFSRKEGFFPKYSGGEYELGNSKMIIGRGLTRKSYKIREKYPIPRVFNPPEILIIQLKPKN